jgi:hypothetical protein
VELRREGGNSRKAGKLNSGKREEDWDKRTITEEKWKRKYKKPARLQEHLSIRMKSKVVLIQKIKLVNTNNTGIKYKANFVFLRVPENPIFFFF